MITSTSNPQVKHLVQLQKKRKVRDLEEVFIVEGVRMLAEVPREQVVKVYISETIFRKREQMQYLQGLELEILSDHVFSHVSDTKTPQGILCIVKRNSFQLDEVLNKGNVHLLILDGLQDPGNVGTIIRTAEGAGVSAVILSKECVDIYNPKTIRSTMGSIFRMPFVYIEEMELLLKELRIKGIHTFAAHLEGIKFYDQEDYTGKIAFFIGNEGNGLSDEIAKETDTWVRIPMHGQVESLNAAVAASILIYEACRQRR